MPALTWEQLDKINQLPNFIRSSHVFAKLAENVDGEYINEAVPVDNLDEAQVVTSQFNNPLGLHRPILDIDFPAKLIESSTPGHYHLYLDKKLTWEQYERLINVLADVGIIEDGYRNASLDRGFTSVRLPWVKKYND